MIDVNDALICRSGRCLRRFRKVKKVAIMSGIPAVCLMTSTTNNFRKLTSLFTRQVVMWCDKENEFMRENEREFMPSSSLKPLTDSRTPHPAPRWYHRYWATLCYYLSRYISHIATCYCQVVLASDIGGVEESRGARRLMRRLWIHFDEDAEY